MAGHHLTFPVYNDPITGEVSLFLIPAPSKQRLDPGVQHLQLKRLHHIIIGSGLESIHDILRISPDRKEDNRQFLPAVPDPPAERITCPIRQLTSDIYGTEVMASAGIAAEPITLGADEYFVLGDNRNHSTDSREPNVGVLHREDLLGRAWVRIYPFDKIGVIQHE